MASKGKKSSKLVLRYLGEDDWSHPVYQDQHKRLWKDIGSGDAEQPSLYAPSGNEFDGEPEMPIKQDFTILPTGLPPREKRFQYQMLDRLRSDCDYYLGYGCRNPSRLCGNSEKEHIEEMKRLWLSFSEDEKPQWLPWEKILQYEKAMCGESVPPTEVL